MKKENITINVLHALKLDEARKINMIEGFVHSCKYAFINPATYTYPNLRA